MADFQINRRLKKIIEEHFKMTPFAFSQKYGDNGGVKTSAIMRERNGISSKMLDKIIEAYPEINRSWILTGEGDMLKPTAQDLTIGRDNLGVGNINVSGSHNKNIGTVSRGGNYEVSGEQKNGSGEVTGVPYYDVDFIGGMDAVDNDQTINPTYYIHFPQYAKAESWVNVTGHSMEPLINHGDMIAMKRLEDWNTYLLYGEVYAIVTDEYRTIKYVRKSAKGEDYLRLIPANSDFDEQDIPKSVVRGVFQILGCAKRIF